MRVLAVTSSSDRSELALFAGLSSRGIELEVLGELSPTQVERLKGEGIGYSHLCCRSKLSVTATARIRIKLLEKRVDILHAFTGRALSNAIPASLGTGVKLVAYRGTSGHLSRLDPSSWLSFLNPRVSAVSCVSESVRAYLINQGISPQKLFTIYKGHELSWYESPKSDLTQFEIPRDAVVVVSVANMRPVKGIPVLLKALAALEERHPQLHTLLVGEVRDGSLDRLIGQLKRTRCLGYRADASAIAGAAHIFVMPSLDREGLPKAVIEAMAQGVCPVVSDAGGLPELVRDQQDGVVVRAGDPRALGEAIERCIRNSALRAQYGESARRRIREDFNISKTVEQTLALYESVKG